MRRRASECRGACAAASAEWCVGVAVLPSAVRELVEVRTDRPTFLPSADVDHHAWPGLVRVLVRRCARHLHLSWESCSGVDAPRREVAVVCRSSRPVQRVVVDRRRVHEVLRAEARARCCCHLCRSWASRLASPFSAWPAVQRAARVRGSQRAGCETTSRYHVGSRARRGQLLGAEILLVVPHPAAGRKRFA